MRTRSTHPPVPLLQGDHARIKRKLVIMNVGPGRPSCLILDSEFSGFPLFSSHHSHPNSPVCLPLGPCLAPIEGIELSCHYHRTANPYFILQSSEGPESFP